MPQPGQAEVDEFAKGRGPFVVAAETTRMPMIFTDARRDGYPILFANESFLALTGYSMGEILGLDFSSLLVPEEINGNPAPPAGLSAETVGSVEICYRRQSGSLAWASLFISPVRNDSGDTVQHFISLMDLTKERGERKRLHLLLDELNHRTLNTLVTVLGIAGQTLNGAVDDKAFDLFEARIQALARTHSLLGEENWEPVGLRSVIDQILLPFHPAEGGTRRFFVRGRDASLRPKVALTLAMVLQELATNAVKHGALSGEAGRVEIAWRVQATSEGDRLVFRWRERGGPLVMRSSRSGFGSRLIEDSLAAELNGTVRLDFDPAGLVCLIAMPISADLSAS